MCFRFRPNHHLIIAAARIQGRRADPTDAFEGQVPQLQELGPLSFVLSGAKNKDPTHWLPMSGVLAQVTTKESVVDHPEEATQGLEL